MHSSKSIIHSLLREEASEKIALITELYAETWMRGHRSACLPANWRIYFREIDILFLSVAGIDRTCATTFDSQFPGDLHINPTICQNFDCGELEWEHVGSGWDSAVEVDPEQMEIEHLSKAFECVRWSRRCGGGRWKLDASIKVCRLRKHFHGYSSECCIDPEAIPVDAVHCSLV